MEREAAVGTAKPQSFFRTILIINMAAIGAPFRGIIRLHPNRQPSCHLGFVGNKGAQFGKRPLGFAPTILFPSDFGSFPNPTQILQTDQDPRLHNGFGNAMVHIRLKPSLSQCELAQPPFRAASAFLLQT